MQYFKQKLSFKIILSSVILFFTFFNELSLAEINAASCNFNYECRQGFICVGGRGSSNGGYTGYCEPIIPIRQLCFFHGLLTGKFGKGVVAFVIITFGLTFFSGRPIEMQKILTIVGGIVLIFGSYQVISFIVGEKYQMCELIRTNVAPSTRPENLYPEY